MVTSARFSGPAERVMQAAGGLLLLLLLRPVLEVPVFLLAKPGAYAPDPGLHEWRVTLALIVGGLSLVAWALGHGVRPPRAAAAAMLVWLALAVASIAWSVDRGKTVRQVFELTALVAVWWSAVQLGSNPRWRRAGLIALLLGVLGLCGVGLYQYLVLLARIRVDAFAQMTDWIGPVAADRLYSDRVYATFISPSEFGDYLALLLPLVVGCAMGRWYAPRRGHALWTTLLLSGVCALTVVCLALTTARGAWLGAGVGLVALGAWFVGRRVVTRRYHVVALVLLAGVSALPTYAQNSADAPRPTAPVDFAAGMDPDYFGGSLPSLEILLSGRTLAMRGTYWRASARMLRDYPLGGVGWGAWSSAYPRYTVPGGWPTQLAHNNYVQVVAEVGPLGLVCFLVVLATAFWGGVRHARLAETPAERWMWAGAGCSVIAFAVHSLTDYALYVPGISWPAFALFGALHSWPRETPAVRRAPRPAAALVAVALALGAVWSWQFVAASARNVRDARVLRAGGRLELARDVAVEAMETAPWDGEAAALAGTLIARTAPRGTGPGWPAALAAFTRAARLQPLSPWVRESFADALWAVGAVQRDPRVLAEALRQRQAAVANYPVHPDLHARLADTARALGDDALAARHAARAAELRPLYHGARERE